MIATSSGYKQRLHNGDKQRLAGSYFFVVMLSLAALLGGVEHDGY